MAPHVLQLTVTFFRYNFRCLFRQFLFRADSLRVFVAITQPSESNEFFLWRKRRKIKQLRVLKGTICVNKELQEVDGTANGDQFVQFHRDYRPWQFNESQRERATRLFLASPSPRTRRMFLFIFSYNCSFVLGIVRSSLIFSRPFALLYRCTGLEMFVPNIFPRLWEYRYLSLHFIFKILLHVYCLRLHPKIRRNLIKRRKMKAFPLLFRKV